MCGIFAYLNFLTPKTRKEVVDILIQGLRRMEYRGYDSAGLAIDGSNNVLDPHNQVTLFRRCGKVDNLEKQIDGKLLKIITKTLCSDCKSLDWDITYNIHCGIAHTRWATHGKI